MDYAIAEMNVLLTLMAFAGGSGRSTNKRLRLWRDGIHFHGGCGQIDARQHPAERGGGGGERAGWRVRLQADTAGSQFRPTGWTRRLGQFSSFVRRRKGEKSPSSTNYEQISDKAALVKALNESLAYCDAVYAATTDANFGATVKTRGPRRRSRHVARPRCSSSTRRTTRALRQHIVYMRLKGHVPPVDGSRPAPEIVIKGPAEAGHYGSRTTATPARKLRAAGAPAFGPRRITSITDRRSQLCTDQAQPRLHRRAFREPCTDNASVGLAPTSVSNQIGH
jgi:hypothetical protein